MQWREHVKQIFPSKFLCISRVELIISRWSYLLTREYPFLFSFETRRLFFYFSAFGASKTIANEYGKVDDEQVRDEQFIDD